jgi:pterin-4a-carbinolamine dehydratase
MLEFEDLDPGFTDPSKAQMQFGVKPVIVRGQELPVFPTNRWRNCGSYITKRYEFRRLSDKQRFVEIVMKYERKVQHFSQMNIDRESVTLKLSTQTVDKPTEIDKEFAKFVDGVFKDITYSYTTDV